MRASISAEPNRMKRMCLVHWFMNEYLMGIIFAANNSPQTQYLLQITVLGGFHTFRVNKRKAVTDTSVGPSHLMQSDLSH